MIAATTLKAYRGTNIGRSKVGPLHFSFFNLSFLFKVKKYFWGGIFYLDGGDDPPQNISKTFQRLARSFATDKESLLLYMIGYQRRKRRG